MLGETERKNGWTLAEAVGEVGSERMQRLLNFHAWDTDGVRDDVRAAVVEVLGDERQGVLVVDETGFAPDFHWEVPGDTETVPWAGRRDTREGIRTFFAQLGSHIDRKAFEIHKILVDDNDAVVIGRTEAIVRESGKTMDTRFATHITVDGRGQIEQFVMYEDSWHVADSLKP